ncbi:MAG TPA: muconolactone Delta-isomerase family protein [Actinophytocola sp.]|uniref:YciI family protein n=1 Tax=Actinophytocola sp. TaxID=1872138 RepID=UPI002DBC271D|nr:muconolactone Delta-isomerase family protein [Actinophytocola sp.]HEU5472995.1 muconolactone Delta-isomerase family protein [Actinophytocola sp.]
MPDFTVETRYTADRDRLQAVRPRHRAYLDDLAAQGKVLAGGPFVDGESGFAVYRVADIDELNLLLAGDPYTTEEVSDGRVVREWTITLGPWAAPPQ